MNYPTIMRMSIFALLSIISHTITASLPKSAYSELIFVQPTPIIKLQFVYNLNPRYATTSTTGTGSIVSQNSLLSLSTGATINSSATLRSNTYITYQPGQGNYSVFPTLFAPGVSGSTQIAGIGNSTDGFFFGYNGTDFGILYRNNSVDTWIPQASWNKDNVLGGGGPSNPSGLTLDPTKGNIYKIQFHWLGFGAINFFMSSPSTDSMIFLHQIQYADTNTALSLTNPNLQSMLQIINTTNATNLTMKNGFISAFTEGYANKNLNVRNTISATKSITTAASFTNLLTIRNNATYQSKTNRSLVYPDQISFFNTDSVATHNVFCTIYLNPSVAGPVSFISINPNTSIVSYDTGGTTVTGGTALFSFYLQANTAFSFSLSDYNIVLNPNDTLVLACQTQTDSPTISATMSWTEGL